MRNRPRAMLMVVMMLHRLRPFGPPVPLGLSFGPNFSWPRPLGRASWGWNPCSEWFFWHLAAWGSVSLLNCSFGRSNLLQSCSSRFKNPQAFQVTDAPQNHRHRPSKKPACSYEKLVRNHLVILMKPAHALVSRPGKPTQKSPA